MSNRKSYCKFITGVLMIGSCSVVSSQALANDAPNVDAANVDQTAIGSFSTSNPNLNEWTLINLNATDTASALDGSGVIVAVLDGEADCRNTALVGRCVFEPVSGGTYSNYAAHATHVSGIVAGNPFGIAPAATILDYGVFADSGWVATGTRLSDTWKSAYSAGAQISSMSFGCTRKALCFSDYELATISSTSLPMLFVKAAGNDGSYLVNETTSLSASVATAALNKILIVGSVNASGIISTFSNRPGTGCLLPQSATTCAPALSWMNHFLVAPGEAIYSSLPNNTFGYMSGTSMATPVVAGVAALLQERWPFLKNSPETVAKILLTSATDLGAPGVDPIYGYGLLNAGAAFVASGSVTIITPISTPISTTPGTTSPSTRPKKKSSAKVASVSGGSFSQLGSVLGGVTVFDQFGRDFRWDQTGTLDVQSNLEMMQMPSRRMLGAFTQDSWAPALFASTPRAASFAFYGSHADAPGLAPLAAPSLRMGVDIPMGKAALQLRLTGDTSPRADFAFDPSMRPLTFFASTDLAAGSVVTNMLVPVGRDTRLMVYGIAGTGPVAAVGDSSIFNADARRSLTSLNMIKSGAAKSTNNGIGVGLWKHGDSGTVVGLNLSLIRQNHGFYDAAIDVTGFDQPTYIVNAGAALSKESGGWDFYLSGEVSHLPTTSSGQAIGFSPTTLVSGEVGMSRSGILFRGLGTKDSLRASFSLPPRAIAGSLRLNYMTPTADGMDIAPIARGISVAELGHKAARFEAGYQVSAASRWSIDFSGGVDLERTFGQKRAAEGLIALKTML